MPGNSNCGGESATIPDPLVFFLKKQVSRETWLGYDHLADGELLQELQVVAHLLTRLQGETVAPPVSLWGLKSVRICGSRILETVLALTFLHHILHTLGSRYQRKLV